MKYECIVDCVTSDPDQPVQTWAMMVTGTADGAGSPCEVMHHPQRLRVGSSLEAALAAVQSLSHHYDLKTFEVRQTEGRATIVWPI